jgi:hypothetical protein
VRISRIDPVRTPHLPLGDGLQLLVPLAVRVKQPHQRLINLPDLLCPGIATGA